jgi:4-amino-4-deoxy-L-arabinose transferase-like glycosyltransferase
VKHLWTGPWPVYCPMDDCMRNQPLTPTHLSLLFLTSTIPRLICALWLPNAFGDAYAYTEQIYHLRRAILNGSFSLASLFGFWLPLYQLICAGISAIAGSPFYVPKLVSALSGGGVCILVYLLTWELTANRSVSLVTTAIAALNPYHILYSSSAMTDVPHAFFILLCAYCCIRQRLLTASLCGLAAGLIRIESWTLIPLIPTVYLLNQTSTRRIRTPALKFLTSATLFLFVCAGPIFWLVVTWDATEVS